MYSLKIQFKTIFKNIKYSVMKLYILNSILSFRLFSFNLTDRLDNQMINISVAYKYLYILNINLN